MQIRIINAPQDNLIEMLERRVAPHVRKWVEDHPISAIGFVQASVPDLFFFADIAGKAANVVTVELFGTCPQTTTTLAVLGETSAVRAAMAAIEAAQQPAF
ncbi:BMC domain-containing protein [Cereibacter sphaeroides]|uniref:BMC domain-containing protein n=1 Tax=Cereibacter sphaeroides TaxID=1063 RepID=A0AAX1UIS4_CERSP|nr:BMC domain-containing protein [Cereibacter sphaeroides]AZB66346.1 BMC domain-containing protein [Cereibacter sphaeroides]AZB71210.1 BMC domain-containing protein [Cereibacter sphaeroides]RHZ93658.1 BMC domain-containing protein [Cereibacter sphaeroides]